MLNVDKLWIVWILLAVLQSSGPLSAQDVLLREKQAIAAISDLHLGTLVVRLPSQRAKLEAMQAVMNTPTTSGPARRRLEAQILQIEAENRNYCLAVMAAFQAQYNFSKVLFIFDYDTEALQNGQHSGIFLNRSLEVSPGIALLDTTSWYFLRFGTTGESGVDAMIISDKRLRDLEKPFPFYQRLNDFTSFLNGLLFFVNPNRQEEDLLRVVEKLNKKLHRYRERAGA
jgi:hypothetical protein